MQPQEAGLDRRGPAHQFRRLGTPKDVVAAAGVRRRPPEPRDTRRPNMSVDLEIGLVTAGRRKLAFVLVPALAWCDSPYARKC